MDIDRRTAFTGGAAALTFLAAARPSFAAPRRTSRATPIVIDGLGGFTDPYGAEDAAKITPRGGAELRSSGITAIHCTVNQVGDRKSVV